MTCLENVKRKTKSYRKPETSSMYLDRCLLVVFGIQNLFPTHCTHALFVGTALAVLRTRLVLRMSTNSASGELILSIGTKSCFFGVKSLFSFSRFPQLPVVVLVPSFHVSAVITVPSSCHIFRTPSFRDGSLGLWSLV